jgi:hypothetical protein
MHRVWPCLFVSWALVGTGCGGSDDSSIPDASQDSTTFDGGGDHTSADQSASTDTGLDVSSGDVTGPIDTGAPEGSGTNDGGLIYITGGPSTIYPPDASACTGFSETAASFEIYDDRDASIDLVLINESCKAVPYGEVAPDVPTSVMTYTDSVWRVQDHTSKTQLGSFSLGANQAYSVTVR